MLFSLKSTWSCSLNVAMNQLLSQNKYLFHIAHIFFHSPLANIWCLQIKTLWNWDFHLVKFTVVDYSMEVRVWFNQTTSFKILKPVAIKVYKWYQVFCGPCCESTVLVASLPKYWFHLIQHCWDSTILYHLHCSEVTLKLHLSELDKHFMTHKPVSTVDQNSKHMYTRKIDFMLVIGKMHMVLEMKMS